MRLYVSVDMEGIAGVAHPRQVSYGDGVDRVDYDRSRALMAGEANAAIEGALELGATDIVVNDSHWQMRNLRAEDLHEAARLVIGDKPMSMTEAINEGEEPFAGAAFIGYHAGAGHPSGVIAHTFSSATIMEVRVGGVAHNEAGLNAIRLGHHGVPVILVSGDDALAAEVAELLPWAERVVVKRGLGYSLADSSSPSRAVGAIRNGMRSAIERIDTMRPYRPDSLDVEVDFRFPAHAAFAAVLPEAERTGPRSVGFGASDGEILYRRFLAVHRLAAAAGL